MLKLMKFTFACLMVGAVALVGTALLQSPTGRGHGPAASGDALLQTASAEVDSAIRRASIQLEPNMRSFSIRTRAFARSNALEARMEFESMANGMGASFSTNPLRGGSTPYWMKTGVQGAEQATGQKAVTMASSMPMVQAVKSNISRLADAHPTLSSSSSF